MNRKKRAILYVIGSLSFSLPNSFYILFRNLFTGVRKGVMQMPRGSKDKYTEKQKRQVEHIEEGYEKKGISENEAEKRAWSTVNKIYGGGIKGGSATRRKKKSK